MAKEVETPEVKTPEVATPEVTEVTKETKTPKTPEAYKAFTTEEDYNKALQSERSKAKNEILKEMGLTNVKDGVDTMAKVTAVEEKLQSYIDKSVALEENLLLTKNSVKEDYQSEALALAKGKVSDKVDLQAALTEVLVKFPSMASKTATARKGVGADKKTNTEIEESGTLKKHLETKYPWLDL